MIQVRVTMNIDTNDEDAAVSLVREILEDSLGYSLGYDGQYKESMVAKFNGWAITHINDKELGVN